MENKRKLHLATHTTTIRLKNYYNVLAVVTYSITENPYIIYLKRRLFPFVVVGGKKVIAKNAFWQFNLRQKRTFKAQKHTSISASPTFTAKYNKNETKTTFSLFLHSFAK